MGCFRFDTQNFLLDSTSQRWDQITCPSPAQTGAGGGTTKRRRRKPSFIGVAERQIIVPLPTIHARCEVALDDMQLLAECTMHEAPLARRRRHTLLVLMS